MPCSHSYCPHHDHAKDNEEDDQEICRQRQAEDVVDTLSLERVTAEDSMDELSCPSNKARSIAAHGQSKPGADAGEDGAQTDALPKEHRSTWGALYPGSA
jgi:hypothetical protein